MLFHPDLQCSQYDDVLFHHHHKLKKTVGLHIGPKRVGDISDGGKIDGDNMKLLLMSPSLLSLFLEKRSDNRRIYCRIFENSCRFFRNFSLSGRAIQGTARDRFLKNSSNVTLAMCFRNFNFRGVSWTGFWKTPSIFYKYLFSFCIILKKISYLNNASKKALG